MFNPQHFNSLFATIRLATEINNAIAIIELHQNSNGFTNSCAH